MTSWLALGVLMLVSFCKTSIFSNELNNQIREGIEKVNTFEELARKEVEEVNREINKVEKIIIEKFEEGIGKDKDIRVLLYLLETMETTKNELDGRYDIFKSCLKNMLVQKSNELQKLKNVFEFTEKFSTGFYDDLRAKMKTCKDQECIEQLVHAAETKKKILTNMFKKYVKEMSNISSRLREGHQYCMRDAQKNFSQVLKIFENDMEYMHTTQGTDDLTDRLGSVILEL